MAGRQTAIRAVLAAGVAAALALAFAACGPRDFDVSGTITIASSLRTRVPKQNCVMFIVAKNMGGVPLAVKRIVNPAFPVPYTLDAGDLLVPGSHPTEALRVEVEMNDRGNVGHPVRGDLAGSYPDPVYSGEHDVHIVIDRQR